MDLSINTVKVSPDTKKNTATIGTLAVAGVGAKLITKATKGKTFTYDTAINSSLKQFAKSGKTFFGSEYIKSIAEKVAKTSPKQKLLTLLTVGTLAAVMGIREHFSKEKGKETQKMQDKALINAQEKQIEIKEKKIRNKDEQIDALNHDINILNGRLAVADCEINGYKQDLKDIDNAARNIGVDKDLAQEIQRLND